MTDVLQQTHGRYVLKAMKLKGQTVFTARAFHDGGPAGTVAETTAPTAQAAFEELGEMLDQQSADQVEARRNADDGVTVPTGEEFRMALGRHAPKRAHLAMLRAHAAAGDEGLTARQLATAADYKDHSAANLHYGKLAYAVAEILGMDAFLAQYQSDKRGAITLLGEAGPERNGADVWVIRPELAQALDQFD